MPGNQGDRRPAPAGDPALDKPSLTTDACKNVDLPLAAFNLNHLVSLDLFAFRSLKEQLPRCFHFSRCCMSCEQLIFHSPFCFFQIYYLFFDIVVSPLDS